MDRPGRARAGLPAVRHGPHGPAPRGPRDQRGPPADQRPAALDHRHLRLHGRRLPDHDGHARRPDRPAQAAAHRRGRVRRCVSMLAAFSTSAEMLIVSRALLGIAGATLAPSTLSLIFNMFQDPRQRSVAIGVWISRLLGRQRHRPGARRPPARALLVGLGVPARGAGHGRAARARTARPARVPGSRRRAPRPAQRRHVARRGPGRDLRAQADRPRTASARCRWRRSWSASSSGVLFVRRQRTPRRPDDRPAAVPDPARSARR